MLNTVLLSMLGLSAGLMAGPMATKSPVCQARSVFMNEDAAKAAWLANQEAPKWGPKAGATAGSVAPPAGTVAPSAPMAAPAAAAAMIADGTLSRKEKMLQMTMTRKPSAYRTPSMGDNVPSAMRPGAPPVAASRAPVAVGLPQGLPTARTPVAAARAARAPAAAAAVPSTEEAAKAAWLAKQDSPEWGTKAGAVPAAAPRAVAALRAAAAPSSEGQGTNYKYSPAWSKYASSSGNGDFAPRRGGR